MELGNLIKQHRGDRSMSQDGLARAIFVLRQTVSNWETGKTYPDVQSLLLMSDLFDVSIDQLVKGDMAMIDAEIEKAAKRMKVLAQVMWGFALFAIVAAKSF
ncbi:helix-turn-helix transcriptional regulator [Curtanaerobium respiraculi]|uniref:helix-turn-helix transcriptional regulator n=1 Tax=Curtanaerobium respiraculi TaxID=2949669 RepID=UPI0024B3BEB2|nr:helix-turn-helix transcriptional regulator [Curtanaerobium respiraculi]